MIRFSFSSFYMSLIFANIMILFLYFTFHSQKLMIKLGLPILTGAVFVTMLRMLLPFEFLFLSHNIYFPKVISKLISDFLFPRFFDRFSLWTVLEVVWFIGIVHYAYVYLNAEYFCSKDIKKYSKPISESSDSYQVMREIQQELPKARRIELRTYPFIQTPAIYGLRKPCILLPENLKLSRKQLYYILHHEIAHFLYHDVELKICVRFLCILYWWNPCSGFLQKKLDDVLEMRVDRKITKNLEQKTEYLNCLIQVADYMTQPNKKVRDSSGISFYSDYSSALKTRFIMLLSSDLAPSKKKSNIILSVFTVLFLLSFVFIFEASYITPEDSTGRFIPNETNTYFIEREDGRYDFYMDGKFIETEDSLEYYNDDIPVYGEEVNPHEGD